MIESLADWEYLLLVAFVMVTVVTLFPSVTTELDVVNTTLKVSSSSTVEALSMMAISKHMGGVSLLLPAVKTKSMDTPVKSFSSVADN